MYLLFFFEEKKKTDVGNAAVHRNYKWSVCYVRQEQIAERELPGFTIACYYTLFLILYIFLQKIILF